MELWVNNKFANGLKNLIWLVSSSQRQKTLTNYLKPSTHEMNKHRPGKHLMHTLGAI